MSQSPPANVTTSPSSIVVISFGRVIELNALAIIRFSGISCGAHPCSAYMFSRVIHRSGSGSPIATKVSRAFGWQTIGAPEASCSMPAQPK
jgi:hypothetical protein